MTEEHNPFDSSAQEAADAREAEVKRLKREQEVDDFKWLMAHRQGRRVMWRFLGMSGLFRQPHEMGGTPMDTAFRCGEQNLGQKLLAEIHGLCPEKYHEMVKEQQQDARRLERTSS